MINPMIRRHLLAIVRGLALFGLGILALVLSLLGVVAATLVVPYPLVARAIHGLAHLSRRLADSWSGVVIDEPTRPEIPVPQQREDGWYVHDKQLYKSPWMPAFMLRMQALGKDPTFSREWGWMFSEVFVGGTVALLPAALIVAGGLAAAGVVSGLGPAVGVAIGVVLMGLGVAIAPGAIHVHALWTRFLLQPAEQSWWHRSGIRSWVRTRAMLVWQLGGLTGLALAAFGGFLLTSVAIVVSWGGLILAGPVSLVSRPLNQLYRRYCRMWTDADLPEPYLPFPAPPIRDADGMYRVGRGLHEERAAAIRAQRLGWIARDPATWRDLLWAAGAPLFAIPSLIPAALVSAGFFGLVWQAVWWAPWGIPVGLTTGTWVTPFYMWYAVKLAAPGLSVIPDWVSVFIGLVVAAVGILLARPTLKLRSWWDRLLLNPTKAARLAQRVEHLTETRAEAVDAQAAELRRIERDLHDGAQARMVSVGLSLAAIERLLETDPDRARAMVAQARESSATALAELRDLVRGIHPPVLAERGLGEAIRAVALDTPLPVAVTVDMSGRVDSPVESAAYFAVCEALANAVRHAQAQRVDITIRHHAGILTINVIDDGHGGATVAEGGGLQGMQRRLGTFDGVLAISSPRGGPTVVTVEVPCALSSPKTSTS
jgi:signal transduction histidine kinase